MPDHSELIARARGVIAKISPFAPRPTLFELVTTALEQAIDPARETGQIIAGRRIINQHGDFTVVNTEDLPRRISVFEKLPEAYLRVLVFDGDNNTRHIAYHIPSIPQWTTMEGVYYQGDNYLWITHWMPLPGEPKETK